MEKQIKYKALYDYMTENGPGYLKTLMEDYAGDVERLRNLFEQIRTNPDEIDLTDMLIKHLRTPIELIIQMYHHPDRVIPTGIEQDHDELERYQITISMELDAALSGFAARPQQAVPEPNIPPPAPDLNTHHLMPVVPAPAPAPEPAPAPAPVPALPS